MRYLSWCKIPPHPPRPSLALELDAGKATSSGADGGGAAAAQQLERAFEERKAAQDSVKEMAERYSALQEKFRCDWSVQGGRLL